MSRPYEAMIVRSVESPRLLRVNALFSQQLGYDAAELAEQPLLEWIHPEDRSAFEQLLEVGMGSLRARHATRSSDWVTMCWQVKTDGPERSVLGILRDPTDIGAPPREPGSPESRMAATLKEIALVVEGQHTGMRCSILLLNEDQATIRLGAGPSLPDEYNQAVENLRIGPGVGSCGTAAYWNERVIVENIAEDPLWSELKEHAKSAGVQACWSHPIVDSDGEVLGAMALYNDDPRTPTQSELDGLEAAAQIVGLAIDRARAEESLLQIERQLHESSKLEALGVLAGGVAHDFNNMLATILGNVELATLKLGTDSAARPLLDEAVTASNRASELCNQMLAYAGRGALAKEEVDCNSLVEQVGNLISVAISKKADLEYDLQASHLVVEADHTQLRQVVMNLIRNAADALGNNTGKIIVRTDTHEITEDTEKLTAGDYVRITVSDTGCGMDPQTRERMFDPFFTTKPTGRGLGLAAVLGIVKRHRGSITVTSEPGQGTTCTVLLPRVSEPSSNPITKPSAIEVAAGRTILVVDDEEQVRKTISAILAHSGYRVLNASDGQEAVELYQTRGDEIDCILLDYSMPNMDGEETFLALREMDANVPVILSSGFAELEILDRFQGRGLAGVVQKPTPANALLTKVQQAIGDSEGSVTHATTPREPTRP